MARLRQGAQFSGPGMNAVDIDGENPGGGSIGENPGGIGPNPNQPIVPGAGGPDDPEGTQGREGPRERQPNLPGQMPSPESGFGPGTGPQYVGPQPEEPEPVAGRPMRPFTPMPSPSPGQLVGRQGLGGKAGGLLGGGLSTTGGGMQGKPEPTDLIKMLLQLSQE